jgi:hypothetical protein
MPSLKAKLFTAASANAGLQALLGTNPFRWYDSQLNQSSAFPAVVVFIVSNPRDYVITGQMSTSWARVQFTVYGTGNDSQNADAVVNALQAFLLGFNAYGLNPPANANTIVGDRDFGIAATQPLTYQRVLDVMILNDELV